MPPGERYPIIFTLELPEHQPVLVPPTQGEYSMPPVNTPPKGDAHWGPQAYSSVLTLESQQLEPTEQTLEEHANNLLDNMSRAQRKVFSNSHTYSYKDQTTPSIPMTTARLLEPEMLQTEHTSSFDLVIPQELQVALNSVEQINDRPN